MKALENVSSGAQMLYMERKHEILFGVFEQLTQSSNPSVVEAFRTVKKEELYNHLEFHQKLIITLLHFNNMALLLDNFAWIYKRLKHHQLDEDFFLSELEIWKTELHLHLPVNFAEEIVGVYAYVQEHLSYIASTHTQIKRAKYERYASELATECQQVYEHVMKRDKEALYALVLNRCGNLESFLGFVRTVIEPVMVRVGFEWEEGIITVAKEHMVSEQVNDLIHHAFEHFEPSRHQRDKKPTVLVATAPKELHAIGAKTVTKMLEFYGFKALYLGADLESEEIIGAVGETMPHAVVLSATLEVHIVELKALIKTLRNPPYSYRGAIVAGGQCI
jgi:methanogenic corrinoid protein MtbC1